ncbi:cation:proton antiporter [Photobacterium sagamiensis]|uniref:cation:proton antiporter n=1 Tax=Photobacterium sagamiensis TaxID=2910241 RepID=UPI003D0D3584
MQTEYLILITIVMLLILSPMMKNMMARLGAPSLVGYILLGFLVSTMNQQWSFITPDFKNAFATLAHLGVVALLFRVGLKSRTKALLVKLPDASLIWVGDVLTTLLLSFVVCYYFLAQTLETSLVIATAFSATSVAVSAAVWGEMHKLNTSTGQLLVDVAELDDLSGVLLLGVLLAIIPALQNNETVFLPSIGIIAVKEMITFVLFITGCYLFSHYLEPAFTRFSCNKANSKSSGLTISMLGTGIVITAIAGYLGLSLAIGALFAGLAFSRDPLTVHSDTKFMYFYELLTPFFFIYIGMQVDPSSISSSLGLAAILFILATLGKFFGVAVPALLITKKYDAILLGLSMIPRAEIAMIVVFQCQQLGDNIVSNKVFATMVLVSVTTSITAPLILRSLLVKSPPE